MGTDSLGKLILRLTVGVLILFHGVYKIRNPSSLDFITGQLTSIDLPPFVAYGVYIGEIVAALMVILGIFSRMGGLFIFVNMIFALLLVHRAELSTFTDTGGWVLELQAFYMFSGLAIFFLGSGRVAIRPD